MIAMRLCCSSKKSNAGLEICCSLRNWKFAYDKAKRASRVIHILSRARIMQSRLQIVNTPIFTSYEPNAMNC